MTQLQPTPPQAAVVPICTHAIPGSLASNLPDPQICPECTIEQHIRTITAVQPRLVDRGGAFQSKETGKGHKALRKVWRDAKIALSNTILRFEELMSQQEVAVEDMGKIQEALDIWEQKKIELSRVPGVEYVDGSEEEDPTEEDYEVSRLMMELLKGVLRRELSEEDLMGVSEPIAQHSSSSSSSST